MVRKYIIPVISDEQKEDSFQPTNFPQILYVYVNRPSALKKKKNALGAAKR